MTPHYMEAYHLNRQAELAAQQAVVADYLADIALRRMQQLFLPYEPQPQRLPVVTAPRGAAP